MATGAVLYGLDIGGGAVPGAVIWIHSGISMLALLLVVYKVADIGRHGSAARSAVTVAGARLGHPWHGFGATAVTGVGLLFAPSTGSFLAYSHLISAAWWTGLMVWHLRRYVGASLRAAFRARGTVARRPVVPSSRSSRPGRRRRSCG